MYQALYRKYRPACFADVSGQEHITKTLLNQLASGNISHAYLFTGPRGTGKTSCAKIFAKAVNCLDAKCGDACMKCSACESISREENLDIMEIDAASNNGVDNIRELRSSVNYTPSMSKYRVYIIDEVHMLSAGAFNALLKTLEEPPAHVIFILATTEIHKLPATIVSRCQRYDFRRLDAEVIISRLMTVAEKEGLKLSPEAARLIANLSDGGMRDALSMLDLCAASGDEISEQTVLSCCAVAGKERLIEIADAIAGASSGLALKFASDLWRDAVDMQRLCEELITHFRNLMLIKSVKNPAELIVCTTEEMEKYKIQAAKFTIDFIMMAIRLLGDTLTRMNAANRRAELEMALIKLCDPTLLESSEALAARVSALERKIEGRLAVAEDLAPTQNISEPKPAPAPTPAPAPAPTPVVVEEPVEEDDEIPPPCEQDMPSEEIQTVPVAEPIPQKQEADCPPAEEGEKPFTQWNNVLKELVKTCPLLVGVLKDSSAYISGDYLLIDYKNEQFLQMIKQPLYKDHLKKAAAAVTGKQYKLGPHKTVAPKAPDVLGTITGKLSKLGIPDDEK